MARSRRTSQQPFAVAAAVRFNSIATTSKSIAAGLEYRTHPLADARRLQFMAELVEHRLLHHVQRHVPLLVTLFGTALGPALGANASADSTGAYPTVLSTVKVLFDGQPAPLLYVSATQINTVVPFSLAGAQSTAVQVEYQGVRSDAVTIPVSATAPGLFTMDSSGSGPGAILNSDLSPNLSTNPAAAGSIVVLYATGAGKMTETLPDGKVVSQLVSPVALVSVTVDGQQADVKYVGTAPTLLAGLLQINVAVPAGTRTGTSVPVALRIGEVSAQSGVTLAIR